MKIVRYLPQSTDIPAYGALQPDGSVTQIDGDVFGPHIATNRPAMVDRLLAPVVPAAILCIGLNYRAHAVETGAKIPEYPVLFMKSLGALTDPGAPIVLPRVLASTQVDYEGELVVVIGKRAKNVSREEAVHHILGYTIGNDVSARDWQKDFGGGQFCRGKTFDTFAPLGPCITTIDEIPDPSKLRIVTKLNGQVMQDSGVADLIFDVPGLVSFLSGSTTLMPGTVIFTGTPSGVGAARKPPVFLKAGDVVDITVDGIGTLSNPVVEEAAHREQDRDFVKKFRG
jgi:2-keto-4-pentenoate hydratase/2-oxohepta-3-ene-1,7-dioic acid hydratase in catechol pathway